MRKEIPLALAVIIAANTACSVGVKNPAGEFGVTLDKYNGVGGDGYMVNVDLGIGSGTPLTIRAYGDPLGVGIDSGKWDGKSPIVGFSCYDDQNPLADCELNSK